MPNVGLNYRHLQEQFTQAVVAELEFPGDYRGANSDTFCSNVEQFLQKITCSAPNQINVLKVSERPTRVKLQIQPAGNGPAPRSIYDALNSAVQTNNAAFLSLLQPSYDASSDIGNVIEGINKN